MAGLKEGGEGVAWWLSEGEGGCSQTSASASSHAQLVEALKETAMVDEVEDGVEETAEVDGDVGLAEADGDAGLAEADGNATEGESRSLLPVDSLVLIEAGYPSSLSPSMAELAEGLRLAPVDSLELIGSGYQTVETEDQEEAADQESQGDQDELTNLINVEEMVAAMEGREAEEVGTGGLGTKVELGELEPCGVWRCLLEGALEGEAVDCALCQEGLGRLGLLDCSLCEGEACVLCWLKLLSAATDAAGLISWPLCPFCRETVPPARVVQLAQLHSRHKAQLPFPMPLLYQHLRVAVRSPAAGPARTQSASSGHHRLPSLLGSNATYSGSLTEWSFSRGQSPFTSSASSASSNSNLSLSSVTSQDLTLSSNSASWATSGSSAGSSPSSHASLASSSLSHHMELSQPISQAPSLDTLPLGDDIKDAPVL